MRFETLRMKGPGTLNSWRGSAASYVISRDSAAVGGTAERRGVRRGVWGSKLGEGLSDH